MLVNLALPWPILLCINTAHMPTRVCLAQLVVCEPVYQDHVVVVTFDTPSVPPHTHTKMLLTTTTQHPRCVVKGRGRSSCMLIWKQTLAMRRLPTQCSNLPPTGMQTIKKANCYCTRWKKRKAHGTCTLQRWYSAYGDVVLCTKINTMWASSELNSGCIVSHGDSQDPLQLDLHSTGWQNEKTEYKT